MPNHITNQLIFENAAQAMQIALKYRNGAEIGIVNFDLIIPMPKDLDIGEGSETHTAYTNFARYKAGLYPDFPEKEPDKFALGKIATENVEKYGHMTWYGWRVAHWGTKWHAYNFQQYSHDSNTIQFDTAWAPPFPVINKLARDNPHISFLHQYSSEDFGCLCGWVKYKNGEIDELESFDNMSKDAIDHAAKLHNTTPENLGYTYSEEENKYV